MLLRFLKNSQVQYWSTKYHMRSGNETVTKLIEHKIHLVAFSAVYVLSALEQFI